MTVWPNRGAGVTVRVVIVVMAALMEPLDKTNAAAKTVDLSDARAEAGGSTRANAKCSS